MGAYYELIMSPNEGMFSHCFNLCWNEKLDTVTKPYSDAMQLRIGNQLRPKLTCWGAALNTNRPEELDLRNIAQIASCVEMLHKASVIIDDLIDNDDARHGQKAFHIEFGHDNTVIFALTLLGRGMTGLNDVFMGSKGNCKSVALYSETIYRMAEGCLQELALDHTSRYDLHRIRDIIDLETITLIKNSLLLGYWSNCDGNDEIEKLIAKIGENCGYIFQILNDLEPYSSSNRNAAYKGGLNIDINRDRKNIVVAYIYGAASAKEKRLLSTLPSNQLSNTVIELYEKYSVFDVVCNEARWLEAQTYKLTEAIRRASKYTSCIDDFKAFIHDMVEICFSRLR